MRQRRRQVPLEDVAVQELRVVRADGIGEVLIVRHAATARAFLLRHGVAPLSLLVLWTEIRLPLLAVAVDPHPAPRPVEQIADALRAFVVGELAARGEFEDRAVPVLE